MEELPRTTEIYNIKAINDRLRTSGKNSVQIRWSSQGTVYADGAVHLNTNGVAQAQPIHNIDTSHKPQMDTFTEQILTQN